MEFTLKNKVIDLTEEEVQEIISKYGKKDIRFKPEIEWVYYILDFDGGLDEITYRNDNIDKQCYASGNMYRTKKDAEFARSQVDTRLNNLIAHWKLVNDKFVPDWGNENQVKYYIWYNSETHNYSASAAGVVRYNIPYFSTKDNAKACIEWLKGEL